jgi:hypothetical protein
MADYIGQMPYANPRVGYASDLIGGLLGYMKDPRRTQQLQGLAGLLESTGIPKTVERLAYGEPLTNINRANVPMLKPETAEALLTLLPVPAGANKAAKAIDPAVQKYGPKLEQTLLPAFEAAYNRGGLPREMVEAMGTNTVSPMFIGASSPMFDKKMAFEASKLAKKGKTPQEIWEATGTVKGPDGQWRQEISDELSKFNTAKDIQAKKQQIESEIATNKEMLDVVKQRGKEAKDLFPKELTQAKKELKGQTESLQASVNDFYGYNADPRMTGNYANVALEHPALFEAYPELKGRVLYQGRKSGDDGMYGSLYGNQIDVTSKGLLNDPRSTTLHELQHAIQEVEGFGVGGMPQMFQKSGNRIFTEPVLFNAKWLRDTAEKQGVSVDELWKKQNRNVFNESTLEAAKNPNLDNLYEAELLSQNPFASYQRLAGEAEARLTQRRMDLTSEDRKKYFPFEYTGETGYGLDVPLESLIYMTPDGTIIQRGLLGNAPSESLSIKARQPMGSLLDTSYRMTHTAPNREFGATLDDLTGGGQMYPADVYSPKGYQYYGTGNSFDKKAFDIANRFKGKPDATVEIYRAVPKGVSDEINPGDWVTLTKDYAEEHGQGPLKGDYKIIKKKVKASDIYTNADSIHEWGYDPQ